tara:strand:- start:1222 stop:2316 length:1095 start_codon:yes stop_codon:yes gene_type:complete
MKKTCLINNFASHYRSSIFQLLDNELDIDSYFGDKAGDIKKMDYSSLSQFKGELSNRIIFKPFYWQKGAVSLFFKNYNSYIITGEYFCVSTWVLLFLSKLTNKKVYLWTHGWYGNEGFFKIIIKKIFFNLSDGLLLYGNYAKELMIKEGFDDDKLHVIYNSLSYESQLKTRVKLQESNIYKNHFKNENPTLIFIGRLTKVKKLNQIIEAQKELSNKSIEVNIVFVGEGEEKENIKTLAIENGLKNIWFYGSCYNEEEIGKLIYNATMCVSPGNAGLTAMHSLVYGTPIITHSDFSNQMPEFEAIETDVSGYFFIKDDVIDLANKINSWLSKIDSRDAIRTNCFKIIDEKYNPDYQLKIFKGLFK